VIDTENSEQRLGNSRRLAEALGAHYLALEDLEKIEDIAIEVERLAGSFPQMRPASTMDLRTGLA
jgi:hypothetical protein